jgi:hypothetical protein
MSTKLCCLHLELTGSMLPFLWRQAVPLCQSLVVVFIDFGQLAADAGNGFMQELRKMFYGEQRLHGAGGSDPGRSMTSQVR